MTSTSRSLQVNTSSSAASSPVPSASPTNAGSSSKDTKEVVKDKFYSRYPEVESIEARLNSTEDDLIMSTLEMEELVDSIRMDTQLLEEENKTFTWYLKNVANQQQTQLRVTGGPAALDGSSPSSSQEDEALSEVSEGSGGVASSAIQSSSQVTSGPKKGKGRGRRRSSTIKDTMLEVEKKLEIATAELERLKEEKKEEKKVIEKNQETVKACMEEAELRIQETRRDMYEFHRDIANDKKIFAEKILRYLKDREKLKETYITKLKLKTTALKTQINKYEHQLKQREDMGEVLHAIDFDQLKIENQQFNERIDQKNKELVKLKLTTGSTVQTMNALTEKLNKLNSDQVWLRKEIKQREDHLRKLNEDIRMVEGEKVSAEKRNTQLRLQHEAVKVPKVEDYIQQKAEMYELEKAVINWKRKVEIAEGQRKIVRQQKRVAQRKAIQTLTARKRFSSTTLGGTKEPQRTPFIATT
jgi:hypothetical protein